MSHQDVGPRLLGAIALITLFAAASSCQRGSVFSSKNVSQGARIVYSLT